MTTQKDILRTMMTQLDDASDKIPEGLYLQFCDHLQNLHNKTVSFSRIGRGRHQTRVGTFEEAPQIPPNEHGYVDVQDYQEAIDRMGRQSIHGPRRSSGPRRCGRCHHVGHDRRSCPYYEGDKRALDSAYQNGQTPTEAGIERKAVFRSNYAYWSCTDGGRIHFEVDLPEAEFPRQGGRDTCTYANLGSRLEIRVAGKYKTYIGLPAKMIDIGETNWNPQTHCLKIALQIAGVKK